MEPPARPMASNARARTVVRSDGAQAEASSSAASQVAHTLTACTRCRQRKTRCDPGLPRCGPCERTNSVCEYYDSGKGQNVNRNYVVYLQHKVRELEEELGRTESEDVPEDQEGMMRHATVRVHEGQDSKYLGPSSGIAITRLVMQLAKQFTDAKSIKDIVPEQRARQIKELYRQEQAKPTSKIYPLISNVAAEDLPNRALTDLLMKLYKLKVQAMYPALHEPTLDHDLDTVYKYGDRASHVQNFIVRMAIAISLQKMDTQYAGLADSYYLAALKYLEHVVRPMDLKTLQCFALMAEYSLLTPTRTAIYYIIGMAVRLVQALGLHEEKTIVRGRAEGQADFLEIDMRRRLFWCIITMDWGLAHSLGRPAMLATSHEHIDVAWFATCDDKYIKPEGIDAAAPTKPTLKKWIAIHFFKMRVLQLEIRRKLYQRKRPTPVDDNDPWFTYMHGKLCGWRDAAPNNDEGTGLDKAWFIARYNTMVVFMYRPSPQVPRPSLDAALKCYDACEYNIYVQREQITKRNVDLTWIFTQAIFMTINTTLWSLSYVEVRRKHSRADVEKHLDIAMEAIQLAVDRWPGVASAVQLYHNLIDAVLKIYEKDGDIPISAATPSDVASPPQTFPDQFNRSQTTSPATVSSASVVTPPANGPPFGYFQQQARRSVEQPPPVPYQSEVYNAQQSSSQQHMQTMPANMQPAHHGSQGSIQMNQYVPQGQGFNPNSYSNPLPQWTPDLNAPGWNNSTQYQAPFAQSQTLYDSYGNPVFDPNNQAYPFPGMQDSNPQDPNGGNQWMNDYWNMDTGVFGSGLNQHQQQELMQSLETDGMEDIQSMITQTLSSLTPKPPQQQTF
ncbi:hypothetical protein LTR56_015218 [Elasticomyces elasticus]|nr:hypothetical protein LTR56_015218 [Elasticomyces elasticus]KAK3644318.1 hypothetical protein LTR22_015322 [Elasticomyces elasticus]KAK4908291.1 hypothetical protein LTR49_022771 [Elasticomyces elasticus]KAK5748345.1 hypothetical protein LTS12_021621 [Elasticomyces elasticus]